MILYQYLILSEVSTHLPILPLPSKNGNRRVLYQLGCLHSRKGGKRPFGDKSEEYLNPCFAYTLTNDDTGITGVLQTISSSSSSSNGVKNDGGIDRRSSSILSFSSSLTNYSIGNDLTSADPYISATRDCHHAQGKICSYTQPCTPCEISRRTEFSNSKHEWTRCQTCSHTNNYGECYFIEGVGPYCWKNSYSWEVVPCRKCCTDGYPTFDDDGICYWLQFCWDSFRKIILQQQKKIGLRCWTDVERRKWLG